jgi:polysaccharide biosynthesis/export protein
MINGKVMFNFLIRMTCGLACLLCLSTAMAQEKVNFDYKLGPGDQIRVLVFQNPDLTLDTRVSEGGSITYPLIGSVQIGGLSIDAAEKRIAKGLKDGGFVQQPQVNIVLIQVRGNQVSVLGQVNKPGRFPLETFNTRVSEMLAMAGGQIQTGSDIVIVVGIRDGKPFRKEIDIPAIYVDGKQGEDIVVEGGDVMYVHRAPVFYIYGEAQRPGSYRIERGMTVQQALALGGGPTVRGTEYFIRLHRRKADGLFERLRPDWHDLIQADDVIYVRDSLF